MNLDVLIGLTGIGVLLLLFATGIELGFAMMIVGAAGFACVTNPHAAMNILAKDLFDTAANYGFTVFPLFMLMGQIGFVAGMAGRLYDIAHKWLGHIPGGLAMATVVGATAFKAICGSSGATTATFTAIAVPQMDRFGYDKRLSTGIVATVGTLGVLIPPSVVLIIYGIITEQSIGKLFMAGLLPGLVIAIFFLVTIYGWCRIRPEAAPGSTPATWKERWSALPGAIWIAVIFLIVIGGILLGYFTPTEAGGVGAFAVLLLALFQKDLTFKKYVASMKETVRTSGMVMMLIAGSMVLGHFITATMIPQIAADWIVNLPLNRHLILILILFIYILGGSFVEDLAFIILATPIFFPAVVKLGFDPIWFGIALGVVLMIGIVIPPVAVCVFIVSNMTKVPIGTIYRGVMPFLIALVIAMILLFIFPQFALWLPSLFFK
jgi:tripartite ATP-independent transporter DctM subunit